VVLRLTSSGPVESRTIILPNAIRRRLNNIFGFAVKPLWDDLEIGGTVGQSVD